MYKMGNLPTALQRLEAQERCRNPALLRILPLRTNEVEVERRVILKENNLNLCPCRCSTGNFAAYMAVVEEHHWLYQFSLVVATEPGWLPTRWLGDATRIRVWIVRERQVNISTLFHMCRVRVSLPFW